MKKHPELTPYYERIVQYHRWCDAMAPKKCVLFIGDSITQGLCTSAVCSYGINYGIGSDTTYGVLKRLPFYKNSINKSRAIILEIGINDFLFRSKSQILENYEQILSLLPSHKKIIISSIFPVDEKKVSPKTSISNKVIQDVNQKLSILAQKQGVSFINNHRFFCNSRNNLFTKLHVGDGIHLSTNGYRLWVKNIQSYL